MTFMPNVGDNLTLTLPGEALRATVVRIVDEDHVMAEIISQPMTRGHMFRLGDVVGCTREARLWGEQWTAQDDRTFIAGMAKYHQEPEPEPTSWPEE